MIATFNPDIATDLDDVPFPDDDDLDRCPKCQGVRVTRHRVSGRQWNLVGVTVEWWDCECGHEWSDDDAA